MKAAINNLSFSAEVGVKGEHSNQEQMKDKNSSESQAIMFTAVGGEGSSLRDSGRWAESLNSYKGWTVVLSGNLIPTIRLLPNKLREKCMETWSVNAKGEGKDLTQASIPPVNYLFCFDKGNTYSEAWDGSNKGFAILGVNQ